MGQTIQVVSYRNYWKIYIEIALLTLLCVSQYFAITALNLLLTGAILLLHLSMSDLEECTIGLFCALPEFNLLNIRIGSISLYYLMVFIFWLRYFQYHNWRISKVKFMVLFILLVIRLTSGEIESTLTWFVLLSVLVLTYGEDFFDQNLQNVVLFTSIVFILSSLAGYLMLQGGKSIYMKGTVWSDGVMSIRFAGIIGDAVFFSQVCALFVAANLTLGCTNRRYLFPALIISGTITVLCLESYAKTGIILLILVFISALLWLIWNRLKSKRTAVLSILLAFFSILAVFWAISYVLTNTENPIIQNYIVRFSSDDLLTGRGEIWKHYVELLAGSWRSLFCALPQSKFTSPFVLSNGRYFRDTHNVYLEMLCMFGLIATLCMLVFVFVLMYRCLIHRKGILWLMPICVMLASGFSLHGNLEFHYYTLIAIALSFMRCNTFYRTQISSDIATHA